MPKATSKVLSPHDALIYVMVTMAAVDRSLGDEELSRIGALVSSLPVFRGFDPHQLTAKAQTCGQILAEDGGLDAVLGLVADALPQHLRETAYALAVEVAVADLKIQATELRLLDRLRDSLDLSKLVVAAIERGAKARHRTLTG